MSTKFENIFSLILAKLNRIIVTCVYRLKILQFLKPFINKYKVNKDSSGIATFPYLKKRAANNILILIFHRVNDEDDPFFPAVPTKVFEQQMTFLAKFYHVISLDGVVKMLESRDIPQNVVAITFDDGYRDNLLYAFPVLRHLSLPATIFLATGAIGTGNHIWHDRVFNAFKHSREPNLSMSFDGGQTANYSLLSVQEKLLAQRIFLNFLRSMDEIDREKTISELVEKLKTANKTLSQDLMLDWDQVKFMHENGISIGSHTVNHPIMSKISYQKALEEISISKQTIEEKLNNEVTTFAYPNGRKVDFTDTTKTILRKIGYRCAVTTIFGANNGQQDLFELHRGGPWESDLHTFSLKMAYYKFSL